MVGEYIGVNREAIKLISKVLPRFKYFIGTIHGVSKESYVGMNDLLGVTGQEMFFRKCVNVSFIFYVQRNRKETIKNNTFI